MAQLRVTYLLIYLINAEFSERAGIQQEFLSAKLRTGEAKQHWLDAAILVCHKSLRDFFRIYWSAKHKCDIEGCEWSLVTDGGLKPHRFALDFLNFFYIISSRKLCAAKFSGIREFESSNVKVVTGCTRIPSSKSQFCEMHKNEPTPVILSKKLSKFNRKKLAKDRLTNQKASKNLPKDQVFILESVLDSRLCRGKKQFKGISTFIHKHHMLCFILHVGRVCASS